ncbi:Protein of unknown function [Lactobacillus delbrueckii subsp. lactis]|nr:Putative uncharacterized protein [Lactobacillus delbrueckii subsp. lactis]CDR80875.1 Protein of unknown function [Lactobacillus delbrueckii subsp. lactis]
MPIIKSKKNLLIEAKRILD